MYHSVVLPSPDWIENDFVALCPRPPSRDGVEDVTKRQTSFCIYTIVWAIAWALYTCGMVEVHGCALLLLQRTVVWRFWAHDCLFFNLRLINCLCPRYTVALLWVVNIYIYLWVAAFGSCKRLFKGGHYSVLKKTMKRNHSRRHVT